MRLVIFALLLGSSGCTLLPVYELREREYCVQRPWDVYCEGYLEDQQLLIDAKSVYDS
jgi:hypothetical protein